MTITVRKGLVGIIGQLELDGPYRIAEWVWQILTHIVILVGK